MKAPNTINPQKIPDWFAGKTLEELDAIEIGGALYFPEKLRSRGAKGEIKETPVLARVPSKQDRATARIEAIAHVRSMVKGKQPVLTVKDAEEAVGAEVFEDIDTYAIVSRSLFEPQAKNEDGKPTRFMLLDVLLGSYLPATVFDIFDRLDFYAKLLDPRVEDITEDEMWGAIEAIAKRRNLSPLAVMRGSLQTAFVVSMAVTLWSSRPQLSSSLSTATSTQDD
jgi:hypothetical protein